MPGQAKAAIPKSTSRTPRKTRAHQFRANIDHHHPSPFFPIRWGSRSTISAIVAGVLGEVQDQVGPGDDADQLLIVGIDDQEMASLMVAEPVFDQVERIVGSDRDHAPNHDVGDWSFRQVGIGRAGPARRRGR